MQPESEDNKPHTIQNANRLLCQVIQAVICVCVYLYITIQTGESGCTMSVCIKVHIKLKPELQASHIRLTY